MQLFTKLEIAGRPSVRLKRGWLLVTEHGFEDAQGPVKFITVEVLAGAYRGSDERSMLTHTQIPHTNDALCGRVKKGHLADEFSAVERSMLDKPPTCPHCLKRDPRFP